MKRVIAPTLIAAGLLIGACTISDEPVTVDNDGSPGEQGNAPGEEPGDDEPGAPLGFASASLRQFDECDAFLDYVHTEGAKRVGAFGFGGNGWFGPGFPGVMEDGMAVENNVMEPEAAAEESAGTSADQNTPTDGDDSADSGGQFSSTNVQVEGVDEPDVVKTDGERILAVTDDTLHLALVSADGSDATLASSLTLNRDGLNSQLWNAEILFDDDRAFVIGQSEQWCWFDDDIAVAESELVEPDVPTGGPIIPPNGYQGPTTVITEIDLSNSDALTVANTLEVRGRYVSARQVGSTVRVVVTSAPAELGFVYPSDNSDLAIDTATETNQRLVAESDLEHWLPRYTLTTETDTSEGLLVGCANIHAPSEFAGFDMLSILTFDSDEALGAPVDTASIMATGDTVYASQDRMYVTSNVWLPPTVDEQERKIWEDKYKTQIHRFSIAVEGPADYDGSGSVDGHLLNQFSMHDRDGTFFVATTEGTPWGLTDTDNQIIAMEMQGDELVEVGRVDNLGLEGERIFSVRYVGELAYLVTFRQTDPFYVVDLSNPADMTVRGELKIPGFSSYLHPISESLILGVGQDADENGFTKGTKVSLFDVSDISNPMELDVWTLPGGDSDVEWDHRAFLYWSETQTAFLPVTQWSEGFTGAVALRVTGAGIEELGWVTQLDADGTAPGQTDCRVIEPGAFAEDNGDLFWVAQEGLLLGCAEGDQGGATGYLCNPIPASELEFWTDDGSVPPEVAGDVRVEACWPEGFDYGLQIRRTLVIEDSLWTLSQERLQSNDIVTLDVTDIVDL